MVLGLGLAAFSAADAQIATPSQPDLRESATLRVGPQRAVKTISASARIAKAGAIVEVDAGVYFADVAVWQQDNVTVRAIGGRVRLVAQGAAAEGKAIWVVRAKGMTVEGFDFEGAAVPSGQLSPIQYKAWANRMWGAAYGLYQLGDSRAKACLWQAARHSREPRALLLALTSSLGISRQTAKRLTRSTE